MLCVRMYAGARVDVKGIKGATETTCLKLRGCVQIKLDGERIKRNSAMFAAWKDGLAAIVTHTPG